MSRYYDIQIFKTASDTTPYLEYTSYPKTGSFAQNDPGALNVLMDMYVYTADAPISQASIQIWGVPLSTLMQANNLTGYVVRVYAGFQAGLPLNNPKQAGLILNGTIFQAYGNWMGTDMTLDLVVVTSGALASDQSNIVFNWPAGTSFSSAVKSTLQVAFPASKVTVNVSSKIVTAYNRIGVYSSVAPFARTLKAITTQIVGGNYAGVNIVVLPNLILVYDAQSTSSTVTTLTYQDLIGQPTWIDSNTIQIVCPMRADLTVGDVIKMPTGLLGVPGAVVTTSASNPQARQTSVFQGNFQINQVHHMGNFRQPTGDAWVTIFNAIPWKISS